MDSIIDQIDNVESKIKGESVHLSKTNITQVKIESKMLKNKLKEEFNVSYEGTDPV
jgi:hypothetical protein